MFNNVLRQFRNQPIHSFRGLLTLSLLNIAITATAFIAITAPAFGQVVEPTATPFPVVTPINTGSSPSTLVAEGVLGDTDKGRRAPHLSVRPEVLPDRVRLLADANVPNSELASHPLAFDFYINRKLFASQVRSPGLNGPVGVDIGPDVATVPFNYSVIVRVIHPNRTFTTMIEGAVFATELTRIFDSCTLTTAPAGQIDTAVEMYVANNVGSTQTSNESASVSFTAREVESGNEVSVSLALQIEDDGDASGTITITRGALRNTTEVLGSTESENGRLTELSVDSADDTINLRCS